MKMYIVRNVEDSELPVMMGSIEEVCKFLGHKKSVVFCEITRKSLVKKKYHIESIEMSNRDEC